MKKLSSFLFIVFSFVNTFAQTTYTWTGSVDNDWQEPNNWNPSRNTPATSDIIVFNNGNNITVENIPSQTIRGLSVTDATAVTLEAVSSSSTTLSINGPSNTNNLFVESGAALTMGDASTLNLNFISTTNQRGLIEGELAIKAGNFRTTNVSSTLVTVAANAVVKHSGGSITASTASMEFKNNSVYQHLFTTENSAIPLATWEPNSTVTITEITTATSITGINGVTFGNFIYNCPNQTSAILSFGVSSGSVFFKGNFTFVSSGSGEVLFNTNRNTNIHFEKPFLFQGGVLDLNNRSGFSSGSLYYIYDNFTQTGGTIKQSGNSVSTFRIEGNDVTYNQTGGTFDNTFINYFLPANSQLTVNSNITLSPSRTFTVSDGASLILNNGTLASASTSGGAITISGNIDLKTNVIQGSGNFIVNTTATVFCAHPDGLNSSGASGAIQVTGSRTFNAGDYVFNGNAAQVTGNGLSTVKNMTINNTSGVTQSSSSIRITELFTLTSGDYQIGGSSGQTHTLRLDGPAIAGTATLLKSTEFSDLNLGGSASSIVVPSSIQKLNALIINNMVTLASDIELHSTGVALSLQSSNLLFLDNFDITLLSTTATISTSSTTFGITPFVVISGTGQLRKNFATGSSSAFTFPIGVNDGVLRYTPFRITFSANSLERIIGVKVTSGAHPQNNSDGTQTHFASRYWSVTDSEEGNGTYEYSNILLYYTTNNPTDVNGNAALFTAFRWTNTGSASGTWYELPSSVNTSSRIVSASATFNEVNGKLGGSDFAIRNSPANRYLWIGGSSGEYDDPLNWNSQSNGSGSFRFFKFTSDELEFDNTGTVLVEDIPTESISKLIFTGNSDVTMQALATNTLSINGPSNTDNLIVDANATLSISATNQLTIRFLSTTNQRGLIEGTMNLFGGSFNLSGVSGTVVRFAANATLNHYAGTITSSAATLIFEGLSTYNNHFTTVNPDVPTATWQEDATAAILGATTPTIISGISGSNLGNLIIDLPNLTASEISFRITSNTTIKGSLIVRNTGTGILNFRNSGSTSGSLYTLNINKRLVVEGGQVLATRNARNLTINISDDFDLTGGTFDCTNINGSLFTMNVGGNYNQTGGTFTQSNGTTRSRINFTGPHSEYIQSGGTVQNERIDYRLNANNATLTFNNTLTLDNNSSFTVLAGRLILTDNFVSIDGGGAFIADNANATLEVRHVDGLVAGSGNAGPIRTGSRTYGLLSNYIFNATAAQLTGNGFAGGRNVTIDNTNGLTQSSSSVEISLNLFLTNGDYDVRGSSSQVKGLTLNGNPIQGTITHLLVNEFTALGYGGNNANIQVPDFVTDLHSLAIANNNGVQLQSHINLHRDATGALALTSRGKLLLGDFDITVLAPNGTISGGSRRRYVVTNGTGQLKKTFATGATSNFVFPVGDLNGAGHYAAFTINLTSNSDARTIGVRTINDAPTGASGDYINRYWVLTDDMDGIGSYTYGPNTQVLASIESPSDIEGEATALGLHFGSASANTWERIGTSLVTQNTRNITYRITASVTVDFSSSQTYGKLGGNDFTLRNSDAQVYTWNGSVNTDFNEPDNWTPSRLYPYMNDILVLDGNVVASATIEQVPSQPIGQLRVINNGDYEFEIGTASAETFTLGHPSFYSSNPYNTNSPNVLEIENGAAFTMKSASNRRFTLNFGDNPVSFYHTDIAGDLIIQPNSGQNHTVNMSNLDATGNRVSGSIINNGGFLISQINNTFFESGSFYIHNRNGGTLPAADWHPNGTFLVQGTVNSLPSAQNNTIRAGNFIWDNPSLTASGVMASLNHLEVLGDLELLNGVMRTSSNNILITVAGNMVHESNLIMGSVGRLEFNSSTSNQTVTGNGLWEGNSTLKLINNLTINNTSSGGTVEFQGMDIILNRNWILEAGEITANSITIGNNNSVTLNVRDGDLAITPSFNFSAYNITYDGSNDRVIGIEAPDSSLFTNGSLNINGPEKTITLGKSMRIATLDIAANNEFDVNDQGYALEIVGGTIISSSGTLTFNRHPNNMLITNGNATLNFGGVLTDNEIPKIRAIGTNLTVWNPIIITEELFIDDNTNFTIRRNNTVTIQGEITGNGFFRSDNNQARLALTGSQAGNAGLIRLLNGAQVFDDFIMNRTSANASVSVQGQLTLNNFTLTSGIVYLDSSEWVYTGNGSHLNPSLATDASYFATLPEWNTPITWNMPASLAAGTYLFPTGMGSPNTSLGVQGFRPVSITTKAANPASVVQVKVNYLKHDAENYYAPLNIPTSLNRADFLVAFTQTDALANNTIDFSVSYQNTDFNLSAPSSPELMMHEGGWISVPNQISSSSNGNLVLTGENAFPSANESVRIFCVAEPFTDPTPGNTWFWVGVFDDNWNRIGNWSPNTIPNDESHNVIVNNPTALFMPQLGSDAEVKDIRVNGNNSLVLGAITFSIFGDFINQGVVQVLRNNTVSYEGTAATQIARLNYWNLQIIGNKGNNQVVFPPNDTVGVYNQFSPNATFSGGGYTTTQSIVKLARGIDVPTLRPYGQYEDLVVTPGNTDFVIATPCSRNLYTSSSFNINFVRMSQNAQVFFDHTPNSNDGGLNIADYTADSSLFIPFSAGEQYNFNTGFSYSNRSRTRNKFRAWIDYNQNGIFENSEEIAINTNTNLNSYDQNFTVPSNVKSGAYRMRVRYVYQTNNTAVVVDPCSTEDFGEVHDYTVIVDDAQKSVFEVSSDIDIARNLFIDSLAVVKDAGNIINGSGSSSGSMIMRSSAELHLSSDNTTASSTVNAGPFPIFSSYQLDSLSTVKYTGAAAQEVYPVPGKGYGNLIIETDQLSDAKTAAGNFSIQNQLLVANPQTAFYYNNRTVRLGTSTINYGLLTGSSSGAENGLLLFDKAHNQALRIEDNAHIGNIEVDKSVAKTVTLTGAGAAIVEGYVELESGEFIVAFKGSSLDFNDAISIDANGIISFEPTPQTPILVNHQINHNGGILRLSNSAVVDASLAEYKLNENSTIDVGFGSLLLEKEPNFAAGKGLTIKNWIGVIGNGPSDISKIQFGEDETGLTSSQLEQVVFVRGTESFASLIWLNGEIFPISPQPFYQGLEGRGDIVDKTELTELDGNEVIPAQMVLLFGAVPESQFVNSIFDVNVRFLTQKGTIVPNYSEGVTIGFEQNPTSASLSGNTSVSALNGAATLSELSINKPGEQYRFIIVSDTFELITNFVNVYGVYYGEEGRGDIVAVEGPTHLGDPIWISTTTNNWNDPNGWSYGTVPPEGSRILISPDATHDLELDQNRSVQSIHFSASGRKVLTGDYVLSVDTLLGYDASNFVLTNTTTGGLSTLLPQARNFTFPVGNNSFNPVSIANQTGTADSFRVSMINEVRGNGRTGRPLNSSIPRVDVTWFINKKSGNSNAGDGVDFVYYYNNNQKRGNPNALRLHHFESDWEPYAGGEERNTGSGRSNFPQRNFAFTGYKAGFSPFALGEESQVLPVEFLSFEARLLDPVQRTVMLDWATSTEINNSHFEVEWSIDGITWSQITLVQGAGTSYQQQDYSWIHNQAQRLNFYRLKQVDYDGNYSYSEVRTVNIGVKDIIPFANLYPNPTQNEFHIQIVGAEVASYEIYTAHGALVQKGIVRQEESILGLASGVYQVKIDYGNKIEVKRIVVAR